MAGDSSLSPFDRDLLDQVELKIFGSVFVYVLKSGHSVKFVVGF